MKYRYPLLTQPGGKGVGIMAPLVVCLAGSGRFFEQWKEVAMWEAMGGRIVLQPGFNLWRESDLEHFHRFSEGELAHFEKEEATLHLRRIDLSDDLVVVNPGGYVGEGTRAAVKYAMERGRRIRWYDLKGAREVVGEGAKVEWLVPWKDRWGVIT